MARASTTRGVDALMTDKRAYVRARLRGPSHGHTCHWPGCTRKVAPARWGCLDHWMRLPKHLRDAIWDAFRPGQEVSKTPSEAYVQAARRAQDWIATNYPTMPQGRLDL